MRIIVTGTDTDVGKTVFAAALAGALGAFYWKPIQAGNLERSDSATVRLLSGLPPTKVLTEAYRLATPCSPHLAAELDGVSIICDDLTPPLVDPLVIEGAGGVLVPVTRRTLLADLMSQWQLPVVLVARTQLGTINHSLLSIEALRSRNIRILGLAFIGESNRESEQIICSMSGVKHLGRLPLVEPLNCTTLREAFTANFELHDFQ